MTELNEKHDWNSLNIKKIEDLDIEFEIQSEAQAKRRTVHGDEFDSVTRELMGRIETLESEVKQLLKDFTTMQIWMKEAARHI